MDIAQVFTATIEAALNRYCALDAENMQRFMAFEGRIIAIEVTGLSLTLYLFPSADGFLVLSDFDGDADATISGTPLALAKLAMSKDPRDLLFDREILIAGDSRLANQFSRVLSQLDIDWEELLAKTVGDITAHKIGNTLRSIGGWIRRSTQSVCLDSGEYLQEEIRLSPSNAEIRRFIQRVDEVREASDRIAARIQILKNKQKQTSS